MTATDIDALRRQCGSEQQAAQAQAGMPGTTTIVLNGTPSEASLRVALLQHPGCIRLSGVVLCGGR